MVQSRYDYDAWGGIKQKTGSSANVFGFTGHEMDKASNLIYMKARFYDPTLGLFLNQDAYQGEVDTPPSLHKYLYAYANPTVYVDLDGHVSVFGQASQHLQVLKDWLVEQNKAANSSGAAIAIGTSQFVTTLGQGVTGGLDIAANVAQEALGVDSSQVRNELAATRKAVSKAIDFVVNGNYAKAVKNVHQAAVRETVKAMEGDVTATANVTQGVLALALARTGSKSKGRLTVENPAGPSSVVQRDMFNMQGIKDRLSQGKGFLEKFRQRAKQGDVSENMATKSGPVAKGLMDTKNIRFTQDSLGTKFKDKRSVQALINDLKSGKVSPNDLPAIRTFQKDGLTYTLDNRRLFAAHQAGVNIKTVPATPAEIAKELPNKFTTPNRGTIIGIRGKLE